LNTLDFKKHVSFNQLKISFQKYIDFYRIGAGVSRIW